MKFIKIKSFKIRVFIILITIIYILYIFRQNIFSSMTCSHLYNSNSFLTCALSNKTCNISILFDSYMTYRKCVIEYSSNDIDYVVFDAVNGLGNRILGLTAVTTYALVTSRVIRINWIPGDNHPVHFKDLFLPLLSPKSDQIPFYYQYSLARLASLMKNRWINEIESNTKSPNQLPRDWAFYFDRQMLCNENTSNQSLFRRLKFYILNFLTNHVKWIRTDQYFVPLLTRNQKFKQSFISLFNNGQIFSQIANRLLHPVSKVNSIVEDFQTKYHLNQSQLMTIGVHMRSWSSTMIDHIEPFQKCIEHVIENITKFSREEEHQIGLYIISNTPQRRQQLIDRISIMYKNLKILHPPSSPTTNDTVEKMQYTLAELLLLSKMKHLIITSKSTFGMVAQGLARKGAWIVRQGASHEIQSTKSDLCQWEPTSEPEYQMIGAIQFNYTCSRSNVSVPSIGERSIL